MGKPHDSGRSCVITKRTPPTTLYIWVFKIEPKNWCGAIPTKVPVT